MVMEEDNAEAHNQPKWLRISKLRRVIRWGDVEQKDIFWHGIAIILMNLLWL